MVSSFEKHAFHMYHAPQRTDFLLRYNLNVEDFLCLNYSHTYFIRIEIF